MPDSGKTLKFSFSDGQLLVNTFDRGKQAFYSEPFGDEIFQSDVVSALDGVLKVKNLTQAILRSGGKPTTYLQVPIDRDITLGGRTFAKRMGAIEFVEVLAEVLKE